MGHKPEGSATGKRYIHRRPGYLKSVAEGIELLFDALNELTAQPFAGRERIDQPNPNDPKTDPKQGNYSPSTCQVFGNGRTELCNFLNLERETRLELATPTLARLCSTN
jgi:hypothetical protein